MSNLGGLDSFVCLFESRCKAFTTPMHWLFTYTGSVNLVFHVSQDPFGVAVGGTLGHCLCTGLAVIGGRMVAQKISVRTGELFKNPTRNIPPPTSPIKLFLFPPSLVTIIGGIVFLAFALSALFFKPDAGIN